VADAPARVALPRAAADATREVGHPVEHGVDLGHHVPALDDDGGPLRRAQGDVEGGAPLRDVDLLAAEHRVDPRSEAGLVRQPQQQPQRLVGDAVLRVVEMEVDGVDRETLAALRIVREEPAQMPVPDLPMVRRERLPGGARTGERAGRHARALLRDPGSVARTGGRAREPPGSPPGFPKGLAAAIGEVLRLPPGREQALDVLAAGGAVPARRPAGADGSTTPRVPVMLEAPPTSRCSDEGDPNAPRA